jgi:catechol 2,3-dioxygenase-like lactoylglutathione lyase family enzyme
LSVADITVSKEFYIGILGFKLEYERTADKFAFISFGQAQIMLEEINGHWNTGALEYPFGRGVNFQIAVQDVSYISERLKERKIALFRDVFESHYDCSGTMVIEKEILVKDPDGYLLRFSQTIEEER